jgi:hypothetical protein
MSQLGNRTLFDFVVAKVGMVPQFWGRYTGLEPRLTEDEADYIFSRSNNQCRILIIYNSLNNAPPVQLSTGQRQLIPGSVRNDFIDGQMDAQRAAKAATDASVPASTDVMIFGDIEDNWLPTPEWIRGGGSACAARRFEAKEGCTRT